MANEQNYPAGAIVRRDETTGTEIAPVTETAGTAFAAQAEARIKARSVVALSRPRDMDTVRVRLLKDCARPGFATVARYALPPRGGKKIEGPSIRFAEAAARHFGNLDVFAEITFEDSAKRILQVTAVDLESNHAESFPVVVDKVMERRDVRSGDVVLGTRTGSTGQQVYLVAVPESEMPVRQGAAVAKIRRNLILAHLPGDILEEAMRTVVSTLASEDRKDPDAAKKRMADAFAELGVLPDALQLYLGHPLGASTPAEIDDLRLVYTALREGQATWAEILKEKRGEEPAAGAKGTVEKLRADLQARAAKKKPGAAPDAQRQPGEEG